MRGAGMTFGSHTFNHSDLSKVTIEEAVKEAGKSSQALSELIGAPPTLFAFPWGRYRMGQPAAISGIFRRVFTTNNGFNAVDDHIINRNEAMTVPHLHAALSGAIEFFKQKTAYFLFRGEQAIRFSGAGTGPLVTFVLPSLGIGGAEIVSTTLAKELVKRGYVVDIVTLGDTDGISQVLPEGLRHVRLSCKNIRSLPLPLAQYLRRARPAAVLTSMWPITSACIVGHRFALSRARIFTWEHSTLSVQYASRGALHRRLLRMSIARTYPLAHARIVVSKGAAKDLAALSGLPLNCFDVVYNPVAVAAQGDDAAAEAAWRGWTGPRVLTVGGLKSGRTIPCL